MSILDDLETKYGIQALSYVDQQFGERLFGKLAEWRSRVASHGCTDSEAIIAAQEVIRFAKAFVRNIKEEGIKVIFCDRRYSPDLCSLLMQMPQQPVVSIIETSGDSEKDLVIHKYLIQQPATSDDISFFAKTLPGILMEITGDVDFEEFENAILPAGGRYHTRVRKYNGENNKYYHLADFLVANTNPSLLIRESRPNNKCEYEYRVKLQDQSYLVLKLQDNYCHLLSGTLSTTTIKELATSLPWPNQGDIHFFYHQSSTAAKHCYAFFPEISQEVIKLEINSASKECLVDLDLNEASVKTIFTAMPAMLKARCSINIVRCEQKPGVLVSYNLDILLKEPVSPMPFNGIYTPPGPASGDLVSTPDNPLAKFIQDIAPQLDGLGSPNNTF